jgi:hypothetical protein
MGARTALGASAGTIENPLEHAFTRSEVVHLIALVDYRRSTNAFRISARPRSSQPERVPVEDEEARATWENMTRSIGEVVTAFSF